MVSLRGSSSITPWILVAIQIVLLPALGVGHDMTAPRRQKRPGAVSGTVVDMSTGTGVAGAVVQLWSGTAGGRSVLVQMSSPTGRFVFMDVTPTDVVTLRAQKVGFLGGEYGQRDSEDSGRTFAIRENEWVQKLTLPMWSTGAIEGQVLDHLGFPLVGVTVRAFARVPVANDIRVLPAVSTQSDDLGRYRLGGLAPGNYAVGVLTSQVVVPESFAGIRSGGSVPLLPTVATGNSRVLILPGAPLIPERREEALVYPTTFSPESRSPSGATMILVNGSHHEGVDIRLTPVPVFSIRGSVEAPRDVLGDLVIRLIAFDGQARGIQTPTAATRADRDGRFTLSGVPRGDYLLEVLPHVTELRVLGAGRDANLDPVRLLRPGAMQVTSLSFLRPPLEVSTIGPTVGADGWWSRRRVSVSDSDLSDLAIVTEPTSRVTGRIVVEQNERTSRLESRSSRGAASVILMLDPADGHLETSGEPVAEVNQIGEFTIRGVLPGKYVFRAAGLLVKAVQRGGADYPDAAIEVTGEPVQGVSVVLTDQGATISGLVGDGVGRFSSDVAVLCFPVEPGLWQNFGIAPTRIRVIRVDVSGRYSLDGLPAGNYYLAVVPRSEIGRWHEPEYLGRVRARARRISIRWGESVTHDFKQVDIPKWTQR